MAIVDELQNVHERSLFVIDILIGNLEQCVSFGCRDVLEDVAGLTFEDFAQHIERAETDGPDFTRLYARQVHVGDTNLVSKIVQRDMPISHNLVEMKNDRHPMHLQGFVR